MKRVYITHCSRSKDDTLKGIDREVPPDKLYTSPRIKARQMFDGYCDIETTGLSWLDADITVIGIFLVNAGGSRLVQLVGREVTRDNLIQTLKGVRTIYTYNGSRFDLPFIQGSIGINLEAVADHHGQRAG